MVSPAKSSRLSRAQAPGLWLAPVISGLAPSDPLRVEDAHLLKYIKALFRFWGLADQEPGALLERFY